MDTKKSFGIMIYNIYKSTRLVGTSFVNLYCQHQTLYCKKKFINEIIL